MSGIDPPWGGGGAVMAPAVAYGLPPFDDIAPRVPPRGFDPQPFIPAPSLVVERETIRERVTGPLPDYVVAGIVSLLPKLRAKLKADGESLTPDEVSAMCFLEGLALGLGK